MHAFAYVSAKQKSQGIRRLRSSAGGAPHWEAKSINGGSNDQHAPQHGEGREEEDELTFPSGTHFDFGRIFSCVLPADDIV